MPKLVVPTYLEQERNYLHATYVLQTLQTIGKTSSVSAFIIQILSYSVVSSYLSS